MSGYVSFSSDYDSERFLKNLAGAIQIPTVSHDEKQPNQQEHLLVFHEFLRDSYPLIHQCCVVETINDLSLLITWMGSDPTLDPLVLMAHQDVVPVEPGTEADWPVDPFSGDIVDDYLWGRGALDDKGPLIAILEAAEHLLSAGFGPTRTVLIVSGHDEEVGGRDGAGQIADVLRQREINPWFVVDEGGAVVDELPKLSAEPVALVRTAEKGSVNLKLTARGEGGHSSAPKRPNAVGKLATALKALEDHPVRARINIVEPTFHALMPRLGAPLRFLLGNLGFTGPLVSRLLARDPVTDAWIRTTTAITIISGGVKANVIPQEATAIVNFRIVPGDTIKSVTAHVRRVVGPEIKIEATAHEQNEPSPVSSIQSEAWQTLTAAITETFPEALAVPWTLIAATDSRYFGEIAGDVYGFSPFTIAMADRERFHGTGERVRVRDAGRAVGFFVRLMEKAAG